MAKAYKNFWSLNTDEAVVTGILRDSIGKKNGEILMPINAQMKDIDLVLINIESKKAITLQIKGSRAYEPGERETERFGDGNKGWFTLKRKTVEDATADYFIFLVYVLVQFPEKGTRLLEPHVITIPTEKLKEYTIKYKSPRGEIYNYYFWVDPKKERAFDCRDVSKQYDVSEYLGNRGLDLLKSDLGTV